MVNVLVMNSTKAEITMKTILTAALGLLIALSTPLHAGDVDASKLSKKKQTPQGLYLSAKETFDLVSAQGKSLLFVDVRTPAEVEFVGAPQLIDVNIPYMLNDFTQWDDAKKRFKKVPNSNFTVAIEEALAAKGLGKDDRIVLMCRSGSRSAKAANLLYQAGYKNVYSVIEGFEGDSSKVAGAEGTRTVNGWKNDGLPYTYKHEKSKMYEEL